MYEPTYAEAVRRHAGTSTQIVYDPLSKKDLALHVMVESYWRIQQAASAQRRRPPAAAAVAWANPVVATMEVAPTEAQHALDSELYPAAAAAPMVGAMPANKAQSLTWSAKKAAERAARAGVATVGSTRPVAPTWAPSSVPRPPSSAAVPVTKGAPSAREPRLCFSCKKPGHSARECVAVTVLEQCQQMMAMIVANNAASAVQPKNGN